MEEETTQAERIALIERLRALGCLPRYRPMVPKRFTRFADLYWFRVMFGRRSSRKNWTGHRDRVMSKRLWAMEDRRPRKSYLPWGRWQMTRPHARLREAFLERRI